MIIYQQTELLDVIYIDFTCQCKLANEIEMDNSYVINEKIYNEINYMWYRSAKC